MLRHMKYRSYFLSRRSKAILLLGVAIFLTLIIRYLFLNFHGDTQHVVIPRKTMGDDERDVRKLVQLTERKQFNITHFYTVIHYSKFTSSRQTGRDSLKKASQYYYFYPKFKITPSKAPSWFFVPERFCHGCFVSYGKRVAILKDVMIDPSFAKNVKGGEPLETVFNQSAEEEYLQLSKGYFFLTSDNEIPHYNDKKVMYDFRVLLDALTVDSVKLTADKQQQKTTIVTIRHEYANLYHSMMNWYNVFILMILFHIDPAHVQILWLDGHPKSSLDSTWKTLFGDVVQARSIKEPTLYRTMIWDSIGATCPLNQHKADILPYSEEFRDFFMSRHKIIVDHSLYCQQLNIRVIFRHKYAAHPRNPSGYMTRKIKNENEVIQVLTNAFPTHEIHGGVMEILPLKEQLMLISETDILIEMHGAGLSHILFLPDTSGVIELMPRYVSPVNKHFNAMAKWRRLNYILWRNEDSNLEKADHFTIVPPDLLVDMVRKMISLLCGDANV